MTGPVDYTGYALYREAMDAFGDPVFARWVCRGYPWGGVDPTAPMRDSAGPRRRDHDRRRRADRP